ncbi:serpin family protein [Candidatus Uabimicrobium amorphum]|uniref:Serine/threonine protein kinase n=1 Tax=Uabimicrobium amorphum TaxID=2596890 RepID=A0A5S9F5K0_UABAM|nr:serpin family protein [Candidatus Uabimicrobium amorphum]BBM86945.1 serine/threonine protein kinase [Candidatus Uabimicrobium amorphum]
MRYVLCLSICVFMLLGCSANLPKPKFPQKETATDVSQQQIDALVTGNNTFAWELYKKLTTEQKNVFFSPYSISTALAMTYAGAAGNTAQQMQKTLHFPSTNPHPSFSALIDATQPTNALYKLYVANALWGQKDYDFLPEFLQTTGKNYGAGLFEVDFKKETEQARNTINHWVEHNTQQKIKELLKQGTIKDKTRLVLTNAIYFKGDWLHPFDANDTYDQTFHLNKSENVQVATMSQNERAFLHYQQPDFQAVSLPYKGEEVEMIIFLPTEIDGIQTIEAQLTAEKVASVRGKMERKSMMLALPKFKAESEFELGEVLEQLGMQDAFTEGVADFSEMTTEERLFISKVVHQAVVNVDEKGTEAAAATGVVMNAESAVMVDVRFIVNRPFAFVISNAKTGSVLFAGRIVDPR